MKILLIQNVPNLGNIGEIKDVKEGFAYNFLIPQQKAVLPNDPKAKEILSSKQVKKKEEKVKEEDIKEKFTKINGEKFVFAAKADEKGHLYGSIGPKEIAEKTDLREQLFKDHFKKVGIYPLKINLGKEMTAEIKIEIKKK